jgi:peptidyl-dipeptidase A
MIMVMGLGLALLIAGCASKEEQQLKTFIKTHLDQVKPLLAERNLTYWKATASGEKEEYDRYAELDLEIKTIYSDADAFARLKDWKDSEVITNPLLARQLAVLYNEYLRNQIDTTLLEEMVELGTAVEEKFNTFRGTIDGEEISSKQIYDILRTETSWIDRKKAWEASKAVGPVVAPDLIKLVKLRNTAARKLGFDTYYAMSLALSEQNEDDLVALFDRLAEATEEPL